MASSVAIPQDIIDNIIESIGDDTRLLKICALVSSEFLLPSRKRLFARISFSSEWCEGLLQFLVENPVLQSFVRAIDLDLFGECHSLISILRLPFCSLECFSVSMDQVLSEISWREYSTELKDALSTIMHLSTLKTIHLKRLDLDMLFQGIHLTKLVLQHVFPRFNLDGKQPGLLAPPGSEEMAATSSRTVIVHLEWWFFEPMHDLPDPIILPFMSHLRVLEIYLNPSATTFRHFDILTFLIESLRVDPSGRATLEHIKLDIKILVNGDMDDDDTFYDDLYIDPVWNHLDSILTHPSGSRLQRVDLDLSFRYGNEDDDGLFVDASATVLRPILDELPLLQEKGILFFRCRK